ncbi:hypothetical protein, conserved [Angomonas deanei]|uniref:Uncharacterized protein n=1 Tax=Angomonas deanei TaxID=59799 RepID=A0A7G2CNJ9_9TRYP|nr:hypothetical protein, conserved [Angomonas deanei]
MSRALQASLLVLCVMLMTCRGQEGSSSGSSPGSSSGSGSCNVPKCESCPKSPSNCTKCLEPYELVNGECKETTTTTTTSTTTTTTSTTTTTTTTEAPPADDDCNFGVMCVKCSRSYGCLFCKSGAFQTIKNGKFVCDMCGQNCAACTSASECTTCVRGAAMKGTKVCMFYASESRQLTTATALAAVAVLLLSLTL